MKGREFETSTDEGVSFSRSRSERRTKGRKRRNETHPYSRLLVVHPDMFSDDSQLGDVGVGFNEVDLRTSIGERKEKEGGRTGKRGRSASSSSSKGRRASKGSGKRREVGKRTLRRTSTDF